MNGPKIYSAYRRSRLFLRSQRRVWFVVSLCALFLVATLSERPHRAATASNNRQDNQNSRDGLWERVEENQLRARQDQGRNLPERFAAFQLNKDLLKQRLSAAPMEFTAAAKESALEITFPMPDGTFQRFRMVESPIMAPELAKQFPETRTYSGQGIDELTARVRLDITSEGVHAQILTEHGAIIIDPAPSGSAKSDAINYISYHKRDYRGEKKQFECFVKDDGGQGAGASQAGLSADKIATVITGGVLHTYRLALAVTGQYVNRFRQAGDTDAQARARAFAAMTTTINRVNGIYETEINVRMIFVANEMNIIYTDPTTDPYGDAANPNNNTGNIGAENQTNVDSVIGSGNYDIGHVFGNGGGGNAGGIGTVCGGSKGSGYTQLGGLTGDPFDVDYVAHEMGHQFGGTHTFNDNSNGSCAGSQYTASSAFEPGSGSTIMSYAGICAPGDLQPHSDAYFHIRSLEQIVAKVNGDSCDVEIATGNNAPAVDAGLNYTIPQLTPFTLNASGSDPDGNALTFCWEQYDLGAAAPPESDNGSRPIFRSYSPVSSPSRTFPSLQYILNNANNPPATYTSGSATFATGEVLPSTNRTMKFQVTARDNRPGGGGVISDQTEVTVTTSSGPFSVTQPNSAVSWPVGSSQTITWDVAGTTGAPVSCANVRILLSTDGGNNFTILVASTPNDGSEAIVTPNAVTNQARIKIEAVGNIFFDISDTNFTIQPSADLEVIAKAGSPNPVLTGSVLTYTITVRNNGPNAASNATVSDSLPPGAFFNSCNATGGGVCGGLGQNRSVTFASLAAGATETITLITEANCSLSDGSLINNSATISSPTFDPNPANNSKSVIVTAMNPPPVIDCPADRDAVAATPGSVMAVVTFPNPNVTDNCPGVTVVCNPPSGSVFPLGVTTVNCTATDSGGATASCSFNIKVWDVCIQDDKRHEYLLFNSFTGEYKFVRCAVDGFVMTGIGVITRAGCKTTLRDDTRVVAAWIDRCLIAPNNTGGATIKRRQPDTSFILNDSNILNNSPNCP